MKTYISFFVLLLVCVQNVTGQYYMPTGRVSVLSFYSSPYTELKSKTYHEKMSVMGVSFSKLLFKGIYVNAAYNFQRKLTFDNTKNRGNILDENNFQQAHGAHISLEVKKMIFSSGGSPVTKLNCFYRNVGISLSPEYNYIFSSDQLKNDSRGEFALRSGIYYHQGSTKNFKRRNLMYSIYYKKAFTPIITNTIAGVSNSFYQDEIGVKLSILIRQLYRFDNFYRK